MERGLKRNRSLKNDSYLQRTNLRTKQRNSQKATYRTNLQRKNLHKLVVLSNKKKPLLVAFFIVQT